MIMFVITLFAIAWSLGHLFVWWMGPCPAFSSNQVCEWSSIKQFWHFPGAQLAAVAFVVASNMLLRKAFAQ